jgi:hypothetical protein
MFFLTLYLQVIQLVAVIILWLISHPFYLCMVALIHFLFFNLITHTNPEVGLFAGFALSFSIDFFLTFLNLPLTKQWIFGGVGLITGGVLGYLLHSPSLQVFAALILSILCVYQAQHKHTFPPKI